MNIQVDTIIMYDYRSKFETRKEYAMSRFRKTARDPDLHSQLFDFKDSFI